MTFSIPKSKFFAVFDISRGDHNMEQAWEILEKFQQDMEKCLTPNDEDLVEIVTSVFDKLAYLLFGVVKIYGLG